MLLAGTEKFNLPHLAKSGPFFEKYYFRFCDPLQKFALWYEQGLVHYRDKVREAQLNFHFFDYLEPDRSFHQRFTVPLEQARLEKDIFYFAVAGGELYHKGSHGRIEAKGQLVEWQLQWDPGEKAFRHLFPAFLYQTAFPTTKLIAPNPDIQLSGWIRVGEKRYQVEAVPGQQGHLWGEQLPDRWTWGEVALFEAEETVSFEGLSTELKYGARQLTPLTLFRIVIDGREYRLNRPWQLRSNTSTAHPERWHFEGRSGRKRFVGDVFVDLKQLIRVTDPDPDRSERYCYHTENAQLRLQLYQKKRGEWILTREFKSAPAMAYEFATREALPDFPSSLQITR